MTETMKVLVATNLTQGARTTDYDHCVEGELVWIQDACDRDRRDPDSCGCSKGFAGCASHSATTTARVVVMPASFRATYVQTLRMSLDDGGWTMLSAEEIAAAMLEIASWWDEGAVLERDFDLLRERLPVTP